MYVIHMFLAQAYNFILNSRTSIYFTFNLIFTVIALIFNDLSLLLFLQPIILVIVFTTHRVGNIGMYSSLIGVLSMNLKDVNMFKDFDYNSISGKQKISEIFKSEFIESLEILQEKGFDKVSFTTHKWVVNNVVLSEKITELFDIDIKESGVCKSTLEVLLLCGKYTPSAYIERVQYKVELQVKK